MGKRDSFCVWVASLMLLCGLSQVRAQDNVIELTTFNDFPPFVSDKVLNGGLHTDIVRESFKAVGYNLKLLLLPWERGLIDVEAGNIVGSFSWARTEARAGRFLMSLPFYYEDHVIFTRHKSIQTKEQFKAHLENKVDAFLCTVQGWHIDLSLKKLVELDKLRIVSAGKLQTCFDMLARDRVHFVHSRPMQAGYLIDASDMLSKWQRELRGVHYFLWPGEKSGAHHIMFSRNKKGVDMYALFAEGLEKIRGNGTYRKVIDRHVNQYPWVDKAVLTNELKARGLLDSP